MAKGNELQNTDGDPPSNRSFTSRIRQQEPT
jgi:hypothetical protein